MVSEKKIIRDVSGWLRVFDDGSVDRTWTGPPEAKFMADPAPPHTDFIDGIATKDVVTGIISGDSNLKVRVYLPEKRENDSEKLPILLHFPGGGFCISQADWYMYYAVYTKLASSARAIVVSVYLRLAPEHRLPAACDDGYAALLWLRSLAQGKAHEPWVNSHADFGRVFLIGDSSGGNLVHQVAARAGDEDITPLKLAGAIPIHPGFVRSTRSKSELEQEETPFLTLNMLDNFLGLALPVGTTKEHPITCPMGHLAPEIKDLKLPPYLYCVADKDLIKDTEMEFLEAMERANKDVELFLSKGVFHSFYLNKLAVDMDPLTSAETQKLFAAITEFISIH